MTKTNYKLTNEEAQILKDVESGKYVSVMDDARMKEVKEIAENTLKKNKNISLRINEITLNLIKQKALEEGIPYQTLISSILHKYVRSNSDLSK